MTVLISCGFLVMIALAIRVAYKEPTVSRSGFDAPNNTRGVRCFMGSKASSCVLADSCSLAKMGLDRSSGT